MEYSYGVFHGLKNIFTCIPAMFMYYITAQPERVQHLHYFIF